MKASLSNACVFLILYMVAVWFVSKSTNREIPGPILFFLLKNTKLIKELIGRKSRLFLYTNDTWVRFFKCYITGMNATAAMDFSKRQLDFYLWFLKLFHLPSKMLN